MDVGQLMTNAASISRATTEIKDLLKHFVSLLFRSHAVKVLEFVEIKQFEIEFKIIINTLNY